MSVLSAFLLELFTVRRPDGGSLTTHFPGFVYAHATVLKVVLAETVTLLISAFAFLIVRTNGRSASFFSLGTLSFLFAPAGLFAGTAALLIFQFILPHQSPEDSSLLSRLGVLVLLSAIWAGSVLGAAANIRKERPSILPLIGLLTNAGLLILFYHFEFYKLGFDQDLWAN